MYSCKICNRIYRTQNSLTRHSHSHQNTKKHRCPTCGVVFYRRDLLTRHLKLHPARSGDTVQSSNSINDINSQSGRKRCHTACLRCRELRTKCNGQLPCLPCQGTNSQCEYSRRSYRLSHSVQDNEISARHSPSLPEPDLADVQPENIEMSRPRLSSIPSIEQRLENVEHQYHIQNPVQDSSGLQEAYNSFSSYSHTDISLPSDVSAANSTIRDNSVSDLVSWPWLHENLFLPADTASFTNMLDLMDFQPLDNSAFPPGDPASLPNPSLLQAGNHDIYTAPNTHFVPNGEQLLATSTTQNDASNPNRTGGRTSPGPPTPAYRDTAVEIGSSNEHRAATPKALQGSVIQDLVTFASTPQSQVSSYPSRTYFWQHTSGKVTTAFGLPYDQEQSTLPVLYHFCKKYAEHFGPLWPLLSPQTLDFDALHPLLFLVLTSIGSMYCGAHASKYGAKMHASIRRTLTMPLELEEEDQEFMWLAQARLLTQVAALYFGQPKAFTYAHHLGALLVTQARRMDLFSAKYSNILLRKFQRMKGIASDQERLSVWMQLEARRRLAFGIFRGDTYTSVLLHTKPLVSLEEVDLQLPMCDAVWRSEKMSAGLCLQMIEHDQMPGRGMWASDIFRIIMDQDESLPPLDPTGQELLLFGLQYPTWRFSKDQELFARLTDSDEDLANLESSTGSPENTVSSITIVTSDPKQRDPRRGSKSTADNEAHQLDSAVRHMGDLRQERKRLILALEKWERNLFLVKTFVRTNLDRSTLMSGLILFHLGFLRLNAPLEDLHQIQYRLANNRKVEDSVVTSVRNWAASRRGRAAAERACSLRNIIARESQVDKGNRLRFNLLAFIGLHHGAVILWAYAGAHSSEDTTDPSEPALMLEGSDPIIVNKTNSKKMLSSFVDLYDCISPARWSSFAKAASTLSGKQFPPATRPLE